MESKLCKIQNKKLGLFFLFAAIAMSLPLIAIQQKALFFQTNDDLLIIGRASGLFYGEPTSELIYISSPLSNLLESLYSVTGNFSWYTILLLLTQVLSVFIYLSLFTDLLLKLPFRQAAFVLFLICTPIYLMYILFFSLQYTQTSIMAAGLGALAFFVDKSKLIKLLGLAIVALSIFWRYDAPLVAVLYVVGLFFLIEFYKFKKIDINKSLKKIIPLASVVLVSYSFYYLNFNEWAPWLSQEKKEYVEIKNVYSQLYGLDATQNSFSALKKPAKQVGWSENDWELFKTFYFLDDEIYGVAQQSQIAENRRQQAYPEYAIAVVKNLFRILIKYDYIFLSSFLFTFLLSSLVDRNRFKIFAIFWGFTFAIYFCILLFGERLPTRVLFPFAFLSVTAFAAYVLQDLKKNFFNKKSIIHTQSIKSLSIVTLILSTSLINVHNNYQEIISKEQWWKFAAQNKELGVDSINNFESDKPIMAFFSFYENFRKTVDPLTGPNQMSDIWHQLILIGWENRSPEFNTRLFNEGLTQDIFTSVAYGDAYLATWSNLEENFEVGKASVFLREHKNIEIIWESAPFVYSDTGLAIWRAERFEVIK